MELLVWLSLMASTLVAPHVAAARFDVDGDTTAPSTILATIEPKAGAPEDKWIRIYFYSSESTAPQQTLIAATPDHVRNWAAILQLTVGANATVSQIDLALPGHVCTVAQSGSDAARAIQTFEFDGQSMRLKTNAFSVCDLKLLGIPNPTFSWNVDIDTPLVARPSSLGPTRGASTSPSW
jgi:hypothetical protein